MQQLEQQTTFSLSELQQQTLSSILSSLDDHADSVAQFMLPYEVQSEQIQALTKALYFSDFVLSVWQKQPHFFSECLQKIPQFVDCQNYRSRLQQQLQHIDSETELYTTIRQFRHREMAKLSICQSLNFATVEQIFIRLSELAEALIIETRDWLFPRLCQELGTPVNEQGEVQSLLILGMGKLGGFELNFSSDIDLIFTYPDHGETIGARRSVDNSQFFTRLAQRLIKALDQHTVDGFVYRVDMRLRPFGDAGALALSFSAMEDYYQEQGRDWERYAMIKARILGEEPQNLNHRYLKQLLRPFVYRRYLDFSALQSLRDMKQKIAAEVRRKGIVDNIKLGSGGIREIEFIVQVFQLIRGGRDKSLQTQSLLAVLPQLVTLNLLSKQESQDLHTAYLFLRRVENILQAIDDKQTQQLPTNERDQMRLVYACQIFTTSTMQQYPTESENDDKQSCLQHYTLNNWDDFYQLLQQQQQKVRSIFQHLIGEETETIQHNKSDWENLLTPHFTVKDIEQTLQTFPLATEALPQFAQHLSQFQEAMLRKAIGQRGRTVLTKLIPIVLDSVLNHAQAQLLLPRILDILEKIATRTVYLELLLENASSLKLLLTLCAASPFIATQIAQYPLLLDELLNPNILFNPPPFTAYRSELQRYLLRIAHDDEEQVLDALRQFKLASQLQVAAADILGILPVMKVSDHLTYLAEAIIETVVNLAWQQVTERYGTPEHLTASDKGFLIIGYGKLGGIELGYKSDLDLVFLHNASVHGQTVGGKRSIDSVQFYLRLAQKIISIFNIKTSSGILYEVDMRLRPSGEAGLLVSSITAFADYQQNEAWTWEQQALVRARAIYGDETLRQQFAQTRQQTLTKQRDIVQLQTDVREMREKMYHHLSHTHSSQFNIKKDRGGITDIEFIAQYLILAYSPQQPTLCRWSDNVRIFDDMISHQIVSNEEGEQLKLSYTELRNKIHHLNLLGEDALVPASEYQQVRSFIQQIWQKFLVESPRGNLY